MGMCYPMIPGLKTIRFKTAAAWEPAAAALDPAAGLFRLPLFEPGRYAIFEPSRAAATGPTAGAAPEPAPAPY